MSGDPHTRFQRDFTRQMIAAHELVPVARLIAIHIVDNIRRLDDTESGARRGTVAMSQAAIARTMGVSEVTVRRAVSDFKKYGYFDVTEAPWKGGHGRGHCNTFKPILKGDPQAVFDFVNAYEKASDGKSSRNNTGHPRPASDGNRTLKQVTGDHKAGHPRPVRTSVPSVCKEQTDSQTSERDARAPDDAGAASRAPVTSAKPTETMVAFAIDKGWDEKRAWDEYDLCAAWHAEKEKILTESGWRKWVIRGTGFDRRDGKTGQPRNSVPAHHMAALRIAARDN